MKLVVYVIKLFSILIMLPINIAVRVMGVLKYLEEFEKLGCGMLILTIFIGPIIATIIGMVAMLILVVGWALPGILIYNGLAFLVNNEVAKWGTVIYYVVFLILFYSGFGGNNSGNYGGDFDYLADD